MIDWFADVFLGFVNRGIAAGWLVLAVLVLRLLLKRAPAWSRVLLWALVGVRLALPFSLESALSLIPSSRTVPQTIMLSPAPAVDTGFAAVDRVVNPVIAGAFAPDPAASVNPLQVLVPLAAAVWAAGVLALAGWAALSTLGLRRRVVGAVHLEGNVYKTDRVASPFVWGLFRPRVYLPGSLPQAAEEPVLAHERAHIARRDHWWKPLAFALAAAYWFHPLLWAAYLVFCRDLEQACDERVVRELSPERRADYSQALLACSAGRAPGPCPLAFGEVGVKTRVRSVLSYKKPAFWVVAAVLALGAVVAALFLTDPPAPKYDFAQNPIASAAVWDRRQGDEQHYRALGTAQREELTGRLEALTGMDWADSPQGEALCGLDITLADGTALAFTVRGDESVFTGYEGESWSVADGEFCAYLLRLCDGADTAPAAPETEAPAAVPLTQESAMDCIGQLLATLTVGSDDTVSFAFPEAIPAGEDGMTSLYLTLNATWRTGPATYEVQNILSFELAQPDGGQAAGGGTVSYPLDTSLGELNEVMLRAAFLTRVGDGLYDTYAASHVTLTAPFTLDQPVGYVPPAVEIFNGAAGAGGGSGARILYGLSDGRTVEVSFPLPQGSEAVESTDPDGTVAAGLLSGGNRLGTVSFMDLGTSDAEVLAGVDTAADELPMPIFATMALSSRAVVEDYQVVRFTDTGAVATATLSWQDVDGYDGRTPEAPWYSYPCVLAYDWAVSPVFAVVELNLLPGIFTAEDAAALAEGFSFQVMAP